MLIDRLRKKAALFYSLRDKIGAIKAPVYRITRFWRTNEIGAGVPQDTKEKVYPSPAIQSLERARIFSKHGQSVEADLFLKGIAQTHYPNEEFLVNRAISSNGGAMEIFWMIEDQLYVTISIVKNYITWDVAIKKTNKIELYLGG